MSTLIDLKGAMEKLSIENSGRILSRAFNKNDKITKMLEGNNMRIPALFEPSNFRKWAQSQIHGIMERDKAVAILEKTVGLKIDDELKKDAKELSDLPLTDQQLKLVQPYLTKRRKFLTDYQARLRSMYEDLVDKSTDTAKQDAKKASKNADVEQPVEVH